MNFTFELIVEAVLAILLLCLLFAVIHAARGLFVKPLPKADGTELFTVIAASGGACQLEQTVRGLIWLGENGKMESRIVIADCGLEEHPKRLAELLARDSTRVTVISPGELPLILEECGWKGTAST